MPVSRDTIRTRFPGPFDDPARDGLLDASIASAELRVSATAFGALRDEAVLLMAAHLATIGIGSAALGAGVGAAALGATSMTAGSVSIALGGSGGAAGGAGGGASTPYLAEYNRLARETVVRVLPPWRGF